MKSKTKIAVIGAGFVGSTSAYTLMMSSLDLEIVLVDVNRKKASGDALDIMHGAPFLPPSEIYAGDYADCKDCDLLIITAGSNQKPGETRIDLLKRNFSIFQEILAEIVKNCVHEPIILVVSNPVDILTYVTQRLSGYDRKRVIGSGTVLDSSRFKFLVGQHTGVDPKSIHAYIIGEHGDSEVPAWSKTSIAGMQFDKYCEMNGSYDPSLKETLFNKVKRAAYEVIEQKGATYYAIALSVRRIVECVLRDERSILTVSSVLNGEYGMKNVALSLPTIVSREGIREILPIEYNEKELNDLISSADTLKKSLSELGL